MNPRARLAQTVLRPGGPLVEEAERVRMTGGGFNEFNEPIPGMEVAEPITVITAPIQDEDREVLPEGLRSIASRMFWTEDEIRGLTDEADADIIRYAAIQYRAARIQEWGGFREVVGVEVSG